MAIKNINGSLGKTTINRSIIISILVVIALASIYIMLGGKTTRDNNTKTTKMENTQNGLGVEVLKAGTGKEIQNGEIAVVNYVGTLENGTKFDSSIDRGVPFKFTLGAGQVIKGWDMGVLGMKIGEKRRLKIPPELAYGSRGVGQIPPNSTLIFDVELVNIQ